MNQSNKDHDIDKLNKFLRGERSAVETYNQALAKIDDPNIEQQLRTCCDSHQARVQELSQRIQALGGQPDDSSGAWGSFAKLVEGGAKMFGKSAAISALEEGEDRGKNLYQTEVDELSPELRSFIRAQIMPEQQRTHDALSRLQRAV